MSEIDGKAKYTGIKQRIHQKRKYGKYQEKNLWIQCNDESIINWDETKRSEWQWKHRSD